MMHVETSQSTRAVANPWKEHFPASLIPYFLHAKAGVVLFPDMWMSAGDPYSVPQVGRRLINHVALPVLNCVQLCPAADTFLKPRCFMTAITSPYPWCNYH